MIIVHKAKDVSTKKHEEDNISLDCKAPLIDLLSLVFALYFFEVSVRYVYIYLFILQWR